MLNSHLTPRKLNESQQLDLALRMSRYNTLDDLILVQRSNQLKLHGAMALDITNEVADAKVMATILERAIKFSLH